MQKKSSNTSAETKIDQNHPSLDHTMSALELSPPRLLIPASQKVFVDGPISMMREKTSAMYEMTPIEWPENTGTYRSKYWYVGPYLFIKSENDAMAVGRSKAQAEIGGGLVFIHRYKHGGVRGVTGELNLDRDPGQMYLVDQAAQVDCIQSQTKVEGVYIPKELIGYDSGQHAPFIRFGAYGALGAAIFRAFDRLISTLLAEDGIHQNTLDRFICTIKTALGSAPRHGDVRRQAREALADVIKTHIERHLQTPDLCPDSLLKAFGVSRASLFRMFEKDGGVRSFIQQRRLCRAISDIARDKNVRGAVTAAADRWGFSCGANFNRAVRDRFGVAPGSLINVPDRDLQFIHAGDDVQAFIHRIDLSTA